MLTSNPRITAAGLALFTNQAPGFSVSVTHIALGSAVYDPTGTETALQSEFARFPIATGADISPSQIQVGVLVTDADPQARSTSNKYVGEIGFYVGSTLLAVLSQADRALFYKSPDLDVPISYVLDFSTLPPGSLRVGAPGLSSSLQLAAQTAQAHGQAAVSAAATIRASYYGSYDSGPATRPDGTARQKGDRYFDTAANAEKTWNGAAWYIPNIDSAALAASDGAALVGFKQEGNGAVARRVQDELRERVSVKQFGATVGAPASVNAAAFERAVAAALAAGQRIVRVDGGNFDITGISQDIHKVILVGTGTVSGVYRKTVVSDIDGVWTAGSNFSVTTHAPRLISAKNPKVVLVGDSISAFTSISSVNKSDNLEYLLRAKLAEVMPHKEIEFVNRAVGGKRYYDLGRDDVADLSAQPWFDGRPWMEYVKEQAPDVVLISFGMNDGHLWNAGNFPPNSAFAVVEKLRAFPKKPDIVFCTNVLPSLSTTDETYNSKAAQEGRDAIAGFTRAWASMMGCGYLDFNRAANALRDGRDILDCYLERLTFSAPSDFPLTTDRECRDYSVAFRFTNYPAGYLDNYLIFKLSPHSSNIFVLSTVGGFFRVEAYVQSGGPSQYRETTNIPAPVAGSSPLFEFSLSRNRVELLIDGAPIFRGPVLRFGGTFVPEVRTTGPAAATLTSSFMVGVERPHMPRVSDHDIYRTDAGGNGINHMNALGARTMFPEVIDKADWQLPAAMWNPSFHAMRLLRGHDGLAIDFAAKQFVIKSEDNPALNRSGDPASIITMALGAGLEYVTDPATGVTVGIRSQGNLGYVALNLLPSLTAGFTAIVEAYQETTGVQNHLFAMTRDAENVARLHARIMPDATAKMATYDDANAISVNMAGSTTYPLQTGRFNRYGFAFAVNDMKLIVNGQRTYGAATKTGVLPSALTRLRIGHDSSPLAAVNPIVIRSIVVIPRALSHNELIALTF